MEFYYCIIVAVDLCRNEGNDYVGHLQLVSIPVQQICILSCSTDNDTHHHTPPPGYGLHCVLMVVSCYCWTKLQSNLYFSYNIDQAKCTHWSPFLYSTHWCIREARDTNY